MRQIMSVVMFALLAASGLQSLAAEPSEVRWHPGHYVILNSEVLRAVEDKKVEQKYDEFIGSLPEGIVGLQGGAFWRNLEPKEGVYDFRVIKKQLDLCQKHKKRFFCTICERYFNAESKPVPDYLYTDPKYKGGVAKLVQPQLKQASVVARFWDPVVLDRYTRLIAALGKRFDREPYFEGVEFIETGITGGPSVPDLTLEVYMPALRTRMLATKKAFPHCVIIQETNYLIYGAGDRAAQVKAIGEFVQFCYENGMGIGGPDLEPGSQLAPGRPRALSYDFFEKYAGKIPLSSDIQHPQYAGSIGMTKMGEFTPDAIYRMGYDTMKLNYYFWSTQNGPGLRFTLSGDVFPMLKREGFKVHTERPENLKR